MKKKVLLAVLSAAKLTGAFKVSRWLTRGDLRIICYHGVSLGDEHKFRPGLFVRPSYFKERVEFLQQHGYPVLALADGLEKLESGQLESGSTVITIDDGWVGTATEMAPVLAAAGFPSMLYMSSYYMDKQTQVFNVAVAYLIWKSALQKVSFSSLGLNQSFDLSDESGREHCRTALISHAESMAGAPDRQKFLERIGDVLGVDVADTLASRRFAFMTKEEAAGLASLGMDVQLHTHRHEMPENIEGTERELADNREALAEVISHELEHFCYPSGDYVADHFDWLAALNVKTATTCNTGFTRKGDNPLELKRFLDSELVTILEFEAEMSGFYELIRRLGYSI